MCNNILYFTYIYPSIHVYYKIIHWKSQSMIASRLQTLYELLKVLKILDGINTNDKNRVSRRKSYESNVSATMQNYLAFMMLK